MIKNYNDWINESWLTDFRNSVLPAPNPEDYKNDWKPANLNYVTVDTMKLLKLLEKDFDEVAIFSWHPTISSAQYSDVGSNYVKSNHNPRSLIDDSIICKFNSKPDNPVGYRAIEAAISNFPYMRTLGGSGIYDKDGGKTIQMQVSFLVGTADTHESAKEAKETKLSSGAYIFRNGEWMFIYSEKFDVTSSVSDKVNIASDLILRFFSNVPIVKEIKNHSKFQAFSKNDTINIYFDSDKTERITIEIQYTGGKFPSYSYIQRLNTGTPTGKYTPVERYFAKTLSSIQDLFLEINENNSKYGLHFITEDEIEELENSKKDLEAAEIFIQKYEHARRGARTGKKFGI